MRKMFLCLLVISFFCYFLKLSISNMQTSDLFFIIDTGREILQNGFVYNNVFTLHKSVDIVIQQWLYCVYIAFLYDTFGSLGLFASIFAIAGAIFYFIKKYVSLKFQTNNIGLVLFIMAFSSVFIYNIRPEALSILLILLQLLVVYKKKYWALPIILLVEANVHISFIWLHWLFLLPYVSKKIFLPTVCSILVTFINPYFVDGVIYLPNSMLSNTFNYVGISEMESIFTGSKEFFILLLLFYIGATIYFRKYLSRSVLITNCLIFVMASLSIRNFMFLFFCSVELFPLIYKKFCSYNINYERCSFYLIAFTIYIFSKTIPHYDFIEINKFDPKYPKYSIEYLVKNANLSEKIYTGFNEGAYLEFFGFKNIYIDCRPELFMKRLNHHEDILVEYYNIVNGHLSPETFLEKYGFQYALVSSEKFLIEYLDENWVLVAEDEQNKLYKKR